MAEGLMLQAHRVRFIDYTPLPIHCLAFSDQDDLALARSDGSIEIWRSDEQWFQKGVIPGRPSVSVEVLLWSQGNLYSSGLDGKIVQWDTILFRQQAVTEGSGGAVWCACTDSRGTRLAAGMEDGFIRLYAVCGAGELSFIKAIGPQGSRILSLSWQPSDQYIFAGGTESIIKRYDVALGTCDMRVTLGKQADRETLVWSIASIDDGHFVSGDSTGKLQIWDGLYGTLLQTFELHLADILSVVVSSDRNMIFAGGIDQKVIRLKRVSKASSQVDWVLSSEAMAHSHDIRALAISKQDVLVSGGMDTTLVVYNQSSFRKRDCLTLYPFPRSSNFYQIAQNSDVFLHKTNSEVYLWQLSSVAMSTPSSLTVSEPREDHSFVHAHPVCLAQLTLPKSSSENLSCCAISDDGTLVCMSNSNKLWMYQISMEEGKVQLVSSVRVKARHLRFLSSEEVLIGTIEGSVLLGKVVAEEGGGRTLELSTLFEDGERFITGLHVSLGKQWILAVFAHRDVVVFSVQKAFSFHSLPSLLSPVSTICFHPRHRYALVLCLNRQLLHLNLETQTLSEWITYSSRERENGLHQHWGAVMGSAFVMTPGGKESFLIGCEDCSIFVNLSAIVQSSSSSQEALKKSGTKRQFTPTSETWAELHRQGNLVTRPQSVKLMYLYQLGEQRCLFIEKNWLELEASFPKPIFRKRYKN